LDSQSIGKTDATRANMAQANASIKHIWNTHRGAMQKGKYIIRENLSGNGN
jgi:hypothetical protein